MNMKMDKKRKFAVAAVLVVSAAFAGLWASGYAVAVNTTASMPRGVYLVGPLDQVKRAEVVGVCIPNQDQANVYRDRGYLPASSRCGAGLAPVIKPVAAIPGDEVRIDDKGTWVNGQLLANSRLFDTDSQGRPIQHLPLGWKKTMENGEYFMLANHIERSLDSRYYGTVRRADLQSRAYPLVTF